MPYDSMSEPPSGPHQEPEAAPNASAQNIGVSFVEFSGPPRVWIVHANDVIVAVQSSASKALNHVQTFGGQTSVHTLD